MSIRFPIETWRKTLVLRRFRKILETILLRSEKLYTKLVMVRFVGNSNNYFAKFSISGAGKVEPRITMHGVAFKGDES